ncbi:hypothetical protein [Bradyrhizobium cytisi]|uniref:hypothetical protein n=1 Tax=Bradyrhizobium cytisi TaxID=515489 RepID=UPI001AEF2BEB|nr:hypothetical protein [Bradyrhizobium cytisi]
MPTGISCWRSALFDTLIADADGVPPLAHADPPRHRRHRSNSEHWIKSWHSTNTLLPLTMPVANLVKKEVRAEDPVMLTRPCSRMRWTLRSQSFNRGWSEQNRTNRARSAGSGVS